MTFYIFAPDKDVDVLAYFALFSKYAVAKCGVFDPKVLEHGPDGCEILNKFDFRLSIRERFQITT